MDSRVPTNVPCRKMTPGVSLWLPLSLIGALLCCAKKEIKAEFPRPPPTATMAKAEEGAVPDVPLADVLQWMLVDAWESHGCIAMWNKAEGSGPPPA